MLSEIKNFVSKALRSLSEEKNWMRANVVMNILLYASFMTDFIRRKPLSYLVSGLYCICIVSNAIYFIRRRRYIEIVFFLMIFAALGLWMVKLYRTSVG